MRDIVFRKVAQPQQSATSVVLQPDSKPAELTPAVDIVGLKKIDLPEPKLSSVEKVVYKATHALSTMAGLLVHAVARENAVHAEVLTPAQGIANTGKKLVSNRKHATKAKKPKQRRHSRITIANSLAVLALLALSTYNYAQSNQALRYATSGTASQTNNASIRQYLPNIGKASPASTLTTEDLKTISEKTKLHAWIAPWTTASQSENAALYSSVSAFWLTLESDGFTVIPKADWSQWSAFSSKLSAAKRYVTVTADPDHSFIALTDPKAQENLVANLLNIVRQQGFDGIDIDFEGLGEDNRDLFTNFARNLTAAFKAENLKVAITLEARLANQVPMDWRNLSLIADELRIMAYDYHAQSTATPGPIAPLGWLKEILDYTQQNARSEKFIIGLGNYGYDWTEPTEAGKPWQGIGISHERAVALAESKQSPIIIQSGIDARGYDIGTAPSFTYTDEAGKRHEVWFEDEASLTAKLNLVAQYKTAGVIFWSVGLGDTDFWTNQHSEQYTGSN